MSRSLTTASAKAVKLSNSIVVFLDTIDQDVNFQPSSLQDAIIRVGQPLAYKDFISLRTGAQNRLRKGGSHHHLLGTKVFASPYRSGKPPQWCGAVPPMADTIGLDAAKRLDKGRWLKTPKVADSLSRSEALLNVLGTMTAEDKQALTKEFTDAATLGATGFNSVFAILERVLVAAEAINHERDTVAQERDYFKNNAEEIAENMVLKQIGAFARANNLIMPEGAALS